MNSRTFEPDCKSKPVIKSCAFPKFYRRWRADRAKLHLEIKRARKLPRIGTRRVVGRRAHTGLYLKNLERLTLRFVVNLHSPRLHCQRSPSSQRGAAKHFLVVLSWQTSQYQKGSPAIQITPFCTCFRNDLIKALANLEANRRTLKPIAKSRGPNEQYGQAQFDETHRMNILK